MGGLWKSQGNPKDPSCAFPRDRSYTYPMAMCRAHGNLKDSYPAVHVSMEPCDNIDNPRKAYGILMANLDGHLLNPLAKIS